MGSERAHFIGLPENEHTQCHNQESRKKNLRIMIAHGLAAVLAAIITGAAEPAWKLAKQQYLGRRESQPTDIAIWREPEATQPVRVSYVSNFNGQLTITAKSSSTNINLRAVTLVTKPMPPKVPAETINDEFYTNGWNAGFNIALRIAAREFTNYAQVKAEAEWQRTNWQANRKPMLP